MLACADPRGRLDDFSSRIDDAAAIDSPPGTIANITGRFYAVIDPVPIKQGALLHYVAEAVLTEMGTTATLDLTLRPLNFETRQPLNVPADEINDITVDEMGRFEANLEGSIIHGDANAVLPGMDSPLLAGSKLNGVIQNADHFCGTADVSTATSGTTMGSTFGAIRVDPDIVGVDLPEPVFGCIDISKPDAGVPDAGPPDAGPPDAALPDAMIGR